MNKAEFEAWKQHTEYSTNTWVLDPVHNGVNGSDYLFHRGGTNGQFVSVDNGEVSIGNYTDAYPHIGEACFMVLYKKQFASSEEAFETLSNKASLPLLELA